MAELIQQQPINLAGAIQGGFQMAQEGRMNNLKMLAAEQTLQQTAAKNQLYKLAANGNAQAKQQLAMVAPEAYKGLQDYQDYRVKRGAQLANSVLSVPAPLREQRYKEMISEIEKEFGEKPQVPRDWSTGEKGAEGYLQGIISQAREVESVAKERYEAPKYQAELQNLKARTGSEYMSQKKTAADIYKTGLESEKLSKEISTFGLNNGEKPPLGYRFAKDGNLEAIPGGPAAKQSAESAGKVALIKQGAQDITRFSDLISDGKGGFNRSKILALNAPGKIGARTEYSTLFNAINSRLRLESGAAVPETEVKRAMTIFAPSAMDSDETIRSKMQRMEEFFASAEQEIGQGRGAVPIKSSENQPMSSFQEGQTATNPQTGQKITFIGGKWQ